MDTAPVPYASRPSLLPHGKVLIWSASGHSLLDTEKAERLDLYVFLMRVEGNPYGILMRNRIIA